jgi:hypothetical protein
MEVERINKLDAACRQINTAISLWFNDGDTVSIHTLACSAHQIVHDINQQRGNRDLIYDRLLYDSLKIKDEYRREANRFIKHPYNFFKHADNDAFETIEFKPILTELFIMFTSLGLEILGRKPDPIRAAFNIYYGLRNPDILTEEGRSEWIDRISEENRKQALDMPKHQFFEFYVHLRKTHLQNAEAAAPRDSL